MNTKKTAMENENTKPTGNAGTGNVSRKDFLRKMGIGAAGLMSMSSFSPLLTACSGPVAKKKPNIVFILSDDQGWNQTGYMGSTFYETPNIDRIAHEGFHFTDAYSASPLCSPARASIMTGKNPARLHLTDYIPGGLFPHKPLIAPPIQNYLPVSEKTIPEYLNEQGYATGHIGKWHLSPDRRYDEPARFWDPEHRGFDVVLQNSRPQLGEVYEDDSHHVESITRHSLQFIEEYKDQPFFLYVSHHVPHRPLLEEAALIRKYEEKPGSDLDINNPIMGAMIERMDSGIGRILDSLDENGLTENTIVVFFSDNGGLELLQSQHPLRGGKAMVFEGGIRVPLCIRWPGVISPGSSSNQPVISDDFLPTLADMLGFRVTDPDIDGISILPILKSERETLDREALYWHYPHYHHLGYKPGGAIRMGDYKLIEWYEESKWGQPDQVNLYNLREDIGETNDLAREYPDLAVQMRRMLHQWQRRVGASEMTLNPHYKVDLQD
ncbi:MAG: sulfatase-like hydrolase/transferase, partial [Cyclonatronaceae bacterium]